MNGGKKNLYEKQIELIERYNSGDESVINELLGAFKTDIEIIAKQVTEHFKRTDDLTLDIVKQEGRITVHNLISKYDKGKNDKPINFMRKYIRYAMIEALYQNESIVSIPINERKAIRRMSEVIDMFKGKYRRDPSGEEIAQEMGIPVDEVEVLKCISKLQKRDSLDKEIDEENFTIGDILTTGKSAEDTYWEEHGSVNRALNMRSLGMDVPRELVEKCICEMDMDLLVKESGKDSETLLTEIRNYFINRHANEVMDDELEIIKSHIMENTNFYFPFSVRLSAFIELNYLSDKGECAENVKDYLICQLEQKGIPYGAESVNTWFKPEDISKGGEANFRESMYKICFALGLDVTETQDFFNQVVLDKAFYIRDINEFIYYYSLCNGLSYQEANGLLKQAQVVANEEREKHTLHETKVILDNIVQSRNEKKLLEYIQRNPQDFDGRYLTARKKVNELIERICISVEEKQIIRKYSEKKEEVEKRIQELEGVDQTSIEGMKKLRKLDKAKAELEQLKAEFSKNQSLLFSEFVEDGIIIPSGIQISNEASMLTLIYSLDMEKREKQEDNKLPLVRQVIQRNLPDRQLGRKLKDGAYTYEYLRKTLIILLSYTFWRRQKIEKLEDEYEAYINRVLVHCNFEKLYEKNPFDWLMMECAKGKNPLRLFRQITNCIV